MTVTAVKAAKKGFYDIYTDHQMLCTLSEEDVYRLNIYEGYPADSEQIEQWLYLSQLALVKHEAKKMLIRHSYTKKELITKLSLKGYDSEAADEAVQWLADYGYLDDNQYAKKYVKDALRLKNHGSYKIEAELIQKGISREIIRELLFEDADLQEQALRRLVEKGLNKITPDADGLLKLRQRLYLKGYEGDKIDNAIEDILNQKG